MARGFDSEVKSEFIRHKLDRFLKGRYHEAYQQDLDYFRYTVNADYDVARMAHRISIKSTRGFTIGLFVAEERMFEVEGQDDWMLYSLQRLEPMMDTLMFLEWFYCNLPEEDKRSFMAYLHGEIERVQYLPPRISMGPNYQSRFCAGDGSGKKIAPDWLAIVTFKNGVKRRETIQNIKRDIGGWFAAMLMVADNKEMAI